MAKLDLKSRGGGTAAKKALGGINTRTPPINDFGLFSVFRIRTAVCSFSRLKAVPFRAISLGFIPFFLFFLFQHEWQQQQQDLPPPCELPSKELTPLVPVCSREGSSFAPSTLFNSSSPLLLPSCTSSAVSPSSISSSSSSSSWLGRTSCYPQRGVPGVNQRQQHLHRSSSFLLFAAASTLRKRKRTFSSFMPSARAWNPEEADDKDDIYKHLHFIPDPKFPQALEPLVGPGHQTERSESSSAKEGSRRNTTNKQNEDIESALPDDDDNDDDHYLDRGGANNNVEAFLMEELAKHDWGELEDEEKKNSDASFLDDDRAGRRRGSGEKEKRAQSDAAESWANDEDASEIAFRPDGRKNDEKKKKKAEEEGGGGKKRKLETRRRMIGSVTWVRHGRRTPTKRNMDAFNLGWPYNNDPGVLTRPGWQDGYFVGHGLQSAQAELIGLGKFIRTGNEERLRKLIHLETAQSQAGRTLHTLHAVAHGLLTPDAATRMPDISTSSLGEEEEEEEELTTTADGRGFCSRRRGKWESSKKTARREGEEGLLREGVSSSRRKNNKKTLFSYFPYGLNSGGLSYTPVAGQASNPAAAAGWSTTPPHGTGRMRGDFCPVHGTWIGWKNEKRTRDASMMSSTSSPSSSSPSSSSPSSSSPSSSSSSPSSSSSAPNMGKHGTLAVDAMNAMASIGRGRGSELRRLKAKNEKSQTTSSRGFSTGSSSVALSSSSTSEQQAPMGKKSDQSNGKGQKEARVSNQTKLTAGGGGDDDRGGGVGQPLAIFKGHYCELSGQDKGDDVKAAEAEASTSDGGMMRRMECKAKLVKRFLTPPLKDTARGSPADGRRGQEKKMTSENGAANLGLLMSQGKSSSCPRGMTKKMSVEELVRSMVIYSLDSQDPVYRGFGKKKNFEKEMWETNKNEVAFRLYYEDIFQRVEKVLGPACVHAGQKAMPKGRKSGERLMESVNDLRAGGGNGLDVGTGSTMDEGYSSGASDSESDSESDSDSENSDNESLSSSAHEESENEDKLKLPIKSTVGALSREVARAEIKCLSNLGSNALVAESYSVDFSRSKLRGDKKLRKLLIGMKESLFLMAFNFVPLGMHGIAEKGWHMGGNALQVLVNFLDRIRREHQKAVGVNGGGWEKVLESGDVPLLSAVVASKEFLYAIELAFGIPLNLTFTPVFGDWVSFDLWAVEEVEVVSEEDGENNNSSDNNSEETQEEEEEEGNGKSVDKVLSLPEDDDEREAIAKGGFSSLSSSSSSDGRRGSPISKQPAHSGKTREVVRSVRYFVRYSRQSQPRFPLSPGVARKSCELEAQADGDNHRCFQSIKHRRFLQQSSMDGLLAFVNSTRQKFGTPRPFVKSKSSNVACSLRSSNRRG